ncbi:MAG: hypothetical protein WBN35_05795 [Acidimicrobiia bacterium]|jgi:hypothetical protein
MAQEAKPTNEYIITLLDRVLDKLAGLADRQRQIEAELGRMTNAATNSSRS